MDREQFKKEFEQFSKEINKELKNGLIDGVLITKGENKNHLFNKEEVRQFFEGLFSLADEFEEMNKEERMKENDFSSLSSKSKLYQAMREEYGRFIKLNYSRNKYYSKLKDDKTFETFYDNFVVNLGGIKEYVDAIIKKSIEEDKPSIQVLLLGSRDEAVLALLSGKLVIDETMEKDGKSFYAYKDGIFYRIEEGTKPVVVDIGKIISKNFFVLQLNWCYVPKGQD